jgi:sugar/nucleoside kinase (ribokinase family)
MAKLNVTFGEIMLRLAPPGFERFCKALISELHSAEAKPTWLSLAGFGLPAAFITVLPKKNALADAAIAELRHFNVDTSRIVRGKGCLGIYFIEEGANQHKSSTAGTLDSKQYQKLKHKVLSEYPNLKAIAIILCESKSALVVVLCPPV